jgi:hypothetical protein
LILSILPADDCTPGAWRDPSAPLFPWLQGHRSASILKTSFGRWAEEAGLIAARIPLKRGDGSIAIDVFGKTIFEPLTVFPYRFRRTMATSLAEMGFDESYIAVVLDDKTLAMATIYAQNSDVMVDHLAGTLDQNPDYTSVVRLFRGRLLREEEDAGLPNILIGDPNLEGYEQLDDDTPLGKCGHPKPETCVKQPPLSCYPCVHFRANPVGRHDLQLVQVQNARRRAHDVEADAIVALYRLQEIPIENVLEDIHRIPLRSA